MSVAWVASWAGRLIQTVSGRSEDLRRRGGAEAVRVPGTGVGEHGASVGGFVGSQPVAHVGGGMQSDAGVTMFVVVPVGEEFHELPCITE